MDIIRDLSRRSAIVGPIVVRSNHLPEPMKEIGSHRHKFPHAMLCVRGTVAVSLDGEVEVLGPADAVNVPAGVEHNAWGMEPDSFFVCLFPDTGNIKDAE